MFSFLKKTRCVSCENLTPTNTVRFTHRNGEDLPLCPACWDAALQVADMLRPISTFGEAARDRYLQTHSNKP